MDRPYKLIGLSLKGQEKIPLGFPLVGIEEAGGSKNEFNSEKMTFTKRILKYWMQSFVLCLEISGNN